MHIYTFLSTLSLRRATYRINARYTKRAISIHALLAESDRPEFYGIARHTYFYPRSPCGERQYLVRGQRPNWGISIHALLAESDRLQTNFSYLPIISIHALLAESDGSGRARMAPRLDFYPRSPCGERHLATWKPYYVRDFYPRSPCGERPC